MADTAVVITPRTAWKRLLPKFKLKNPDSEAARRIEVGKGVIRVRNWRDTLVLMARLEPGRSFQVSEANRKMGDWYSREDLPDGTAVFTHHLGWGDAETTDEEWDLYKPGKDELEKVRGSRRRSIVVFIFFVLVLIDGFLLYLYMY